MPDRPTTRPMETASSAVRALARRVLPRPLVVYLQKRRNRFLALKLETGGLLDADAYARLYEEARCLPPGDVVEVGGAGGSGSIAIAWGLQETGHPSRVIVVEKCEGGSRDRYGDFGTNLERLHRHLEHFGVADRVSLFTERLTFDNGHEVLEKVRTPELSAFCCDADGRIHRDFYFFWPRLRPGGLIVIDDYHETFSRKHAVTYHLLNQLMEWGLFELESTVGSTCFGRKPARADWSLFDRDACELICDRVTAEWEAAAERKQPAPA